MPSVLSVTIDAGVLAVPQPNCTYNDAYRYVDTLLDWKKLLDEPWVAIYMSERTSEALLENSLFPFREHLNELFHTHGIEEYDVNTVVTIANRLLQITPHFETYYRLKDVLADHVETEPDVLKLITCDGIQTDLARCIVLIAILRKHCLQPLGGHPLILREAQNETIKVRARIHCLEHERNDIPDLTYPPEVFEGDVLVCNNFRGLIECLDESTIFIGASDNLGIKLAIRIAVFKRALDKGEEPDWENITVPDIGTEFREACKRCCSGQENSLPTKILRSIVETVRQENLRNVHALRVGSGGNDPRLTRGFDKAKAQRRDIDRVFHLHYWERPNGTIELASVVHHDDFSIPE